MRKILFIATYFIVLNTLATTTEQEDSRITAVLNSPMIKNSLKGLRAEQNLTCRITTDESGDKTVQFFLESGLSKFKALFLCDDGRSVIFTGVIGDGGQTATEKFELTTAE